MSLKPYFPTSEMLIPLFTVSVKYCRTTSVVHKGQPQKFHSGELFLSIIFCKNMNCQCHIFLLRLHFITPKKFAYMHYYSIWALNLTKLSNIFFNLFLQVCFCFYTYSGGFETFGPNFKKFTVCSPFYKGCPIFLRF